MENKTADVNLDLKLTADIVIHKKYLVQMSSIIEMDVVN